MEQLQIEHGRWVDRNFPDQAPWQPILGVIEELGELAHGFLKTSQGIRGSSSDHLAEMEDAVGDIVIYLISFCHSQGLSFSECVTNAMRHVHQRDWVTYPRTGRPPE